MSLDEVEKSDRAIVLVDFRWNKTSQLWYLDKPQRRSHFAASHHSLSITQEFVDDPSKKGWLPGAHFCHFWHCDTLSPGLMCWLKAQQSREVQWAGTSLPAQQHRLQPPGDACPLPPSVVFPAIFSALLQIVFCFPSLFAGFGGFYITFFYKLFLCFWSPHHGFPCKLRDHLVLEAAAPFSCHWPFIPFGAGNLYSPHRLHTVHPWMKELIALNNIHSYPLSYKITSQSDLFMNKVRHLHHCPEFTTIISLKIKKNPE